MLRTSHLKINNLRRIIAVSLQLYTYVVNSFLHTYIHTYVRTYLIVSFQFNNAVELLYNWKVWWQKGLVNSLLYNSYTHTSRSLRNL